MATSPASSTGPEGRCVTFAVRKEPDEKQWCVGDGRTGEEKTQKGQRVIQGLGV